MRALCGVVLATLLTGVAFAQAGKSLDANSHFVGIWVVDVARSNYASMPAPKSIRFQITQASATAFAYKYSEVSNDGEQYQEDWSGNPDGKPHLVLSVPPSQTKQSVAWDGDTLIVRFSTPQGYFEEHLTVSPDAKTLTVKRTVKTDRGDLNVTEVFVREAKKSAG